jgi:F1F0 ATPase subunit 2
MAPEEGVGSVNIGPLEAIMAFLGGVVLGGFFFGGLWLTVRRLPDARHPALLTLGSLLIRTAVVAAGFCFLMGGEWMRAIVALAGLITTRILIIRRAARLGVAVSSPEEIQKHGN